MSKFGVLLLNFSHIIFLWNKKMMESWCLTCLWSLRKYQYKYTFTDESLDRTFQKHSQFYNCKKRFEVINDILLFFMFIIVCKILNTCCLSPKYQKQDKDTILTIIVQNCVWGLSQFRKTLWSVSTGNKWIRLSVFADIITLYLGYSRE